MTAKKAQAVEEDLGNIGDISSHHRCVQHGVIREILSGREDSSNRKWWVIGVVGTMMVTLFTVSIQDSRSTRQELLHRMDVIQETMQKQFIELKLEIKDIQIDSGWGRGMPKGSRSSGRAKEET